MIEVLTNKAGTDAATQHPTHTPQHHHDTRYHTPLLSSTPHPLHLTHINTPRTTPPHTPPHIPHSQKEVQAPGSASTPQVGSDALVEAPEALILQDV